MDQNSPRPAGYGPNLLNWLVANVLFLKRRLNGMSGGGSGGPSFYDTDGTLTSNRTVNGDNKNLTFNDILHEIHALGQFQLYSQDGLTPFLDVTGDGTTIYNRLVLPTMQIHTDGGNVLMNNSIRGLIYDPNNPQNNITITLPDTLSDGEEILILFGGSITNGVVATNITIAPSTGQTYIGSNTFTTATCNTTLTYKYRADIAAWYRID